MRKIAPALALAVSALAALSLAGAPAARADGEAPDPGVYLVDLTLAPVCLDGAYPISVDAGSGPIGGTLTVATDARGKLAGTLGLSGHTYALTGKTSSTSKGFRISMTAKDGKDRIDFYGAYFGPLVTGTTKGKGTLAAGKGTFSLDVGTAQPLVASILAQLAPAKKGRLGGTATATVCGNPIDLSATGKPGRTFKLTLKAHGLKIVGTGTGTLAWTVKGLGADVSGQNLPLEPLPPPSGLAYGVTSAFYEEEEPIPANYPKTFMPPLTTFTAAPALPSGLVVDAATGVVSGTPNPGAASGQFTITAANPSGVAQTVLTMTVRINHSRSFAPETEPLEDDDLRHFLRRTQWGARETEFDALKAEGLDAYLDQMLTFPPSPTAAETAAFPLLTTAQDPAGEFPSATAVARWWTQIMAETAAPFQETLAFFWHDHFGVSTANFDGSERRWCVDHVNLLRREGNGNLRTLLLDVARDPAMLKFLDGVQNTKGRPNENFAREFWELFTLGVDNGYTQDDIVEAARAWTGYRERFDSVSGLQNIELDLAARHDTGSKQILGQTIVGQNATDDYAEVVDITLAQRPVAEFITRKLFRYFCYDDPPQALVDAMAADLRSRNYELAPFLKALFRSEAFFSKKSRRALVKSPVEYTLGFIRSTGLKMTTSSASNPVLDVNTLDNSLNNQGQRPSQPPTVDGWPSGDLWLAAQGMVERINVVHVCVDDTVDQARLGINVANLLPPVEERTADAVVDTLANLLDVQLSTQDRADLVTYLNTVRDVNGNVTSSPFDGSSQAQLDERVRGLLYALSQHPSYQVR